MEVSRRCEEKYGQWAILEHVYRIRVASCRCRYHVKLDALLKNSDVSNCHLTISMHGRVRHHVVLLEARLVDAPVRALAPLERFVPSVTPQVNLQVRAATGTVGTVAALKRPHPGVSACVANESAATGASVATLAVRVRPLPSVNASVRLQGVALSAPVVTLPARVQRTASPNAGGHHRLLQLRRHGPRVAAHQRAHRGAVAVVRLHHRGCRLRG